MDEVNDSPESRRKCAGCGSRGFARSVLGPARCEFCDGTVGGNPPTPNEIRDALRSRFPDEMLLAYIEGLVISGKTPEQEIPAKLAQIAVRAYWRQHPDVLRVALATLATKDDELLHWAITKTGT